MTPHPDFETLQVPMSLTLGAYHLKILTGADVEVDFEAVTHSRSVLQGLFGPTWPEGLTLEDNLTDLHWHHREFTAKRSFAWVIRDESGTYLGCAYLFPDTGARGAGEAVLSQTFSVFRLLADFATWFSNKQAAGCIGCRLISREPIILKA